MHCGPREDNLSSGAEASGVGLNETPPHRGFAVRAKHKIQSRYRNIHCGTCMNECYRIIWTNVECFRAHAAED